MDWAIARERGENNVIAIQGVLILERSDSFSASVATVAPNPVPRFA